MAGGEARFRAMHALFANKIDTDPHIKGPAKIAFWAEIELAPGNDDSAILNAFRTACSSRQWTGPDPSPPFDADEKLGSAQHVDSLVNDLSAQHDPADPLPPPTPSETRLQLTRIVHEADTNKALSDFVNLFGPKHLRAMRYGAGTRIFAFRNPDNRSEPLATSTTRVLFDRLAIPNASADDYLMVEFPANVLTRSKTPTCFDANYHNLLLFLPGGVTAPPAGLTGLPELVVAPPLCQEISYAPRKIA
ncbi:hypothetical protein [Rhizobium leguminosarum]|uniref:hypothetical protein n=1 Tax=Rhizobium leguminosarum TaxID=384 RepID=UPI003F94F886